MNEMKEKSKNNTDNDDSKSAYSSNSKSAYSSKSNIVTKRTKNFDNKITEPSRILYS